MNLFVTFNPESDCSFSSLRKSQVASLSLVLDSKLASIQSIQKQCYISEQILSSCARTGEVEKVNALTNNL